MCRTRAFAPLLRRPGGSGRRQREHPPEAHEPSNTIGHRPIPAARIMVIDYDPTNCAMTSEALSRAGYEVTTASDGAEGVECLPGGGYSAVIADAALRGLDASVLAAWIVAHTTELRDRIILVGDDLDAGRVVLPPEVRIRYLRKPFDEAALLAAVRDVLAPAPGTWPSCRSPSGSRPSPKPRARPPRCRGRSGPGRRQTPRPRRNARHSCR